MESELEKITSISFGKLKRRNSEDSSDRGPTFVSGFAAGEARQTENRKRSTADVDKDASGMLRRAEPVHLTEADRAGEGPAARSDGTRSQYHSIQQLSQSGRSDAGHPFPGAETAAFEQSGIGCCRLPVDNCEEDTLLVLRSLLRRYDIYTQPRMAADVYHGEESDRVVSSGTSNSMRDDHSPCPNELYLEQAQPLARSPTMQAKRARVEHIVSNIRTPSCTDDAAAGSNCGRGSFSLDAVRGDGQRRSKRKQMVPQQHDLTCSVDYDERRKSSSGNLSEDDNDDEKSPTASALSAIPSSNFPVSDDDDDDDDIATSPRGPPNNEDVELRRQLSVVQSRLEHMYAKYAKSFHADDLNDPDARHLEPDSKARDNAERLTGLLKAEVRHMVDGLVDGLIQRFLAKHFAERQRPPNQPRPPDVARLSLPVFPLPPLFPPLPFPVGDGEVLRRAYAQRCAYVDALVQRGARPACPADRKDAVSSYCNAVSGPTSVTSSSSEIVDHSLPISAFPSHCCVGEKQPQTQVYQECLRKLD